MMPGGVIVGFVSDLYDGRRACVIATFMCFLAPLLWFFAMYSDTMPPILLLHLLGLMGILVGGPNNIITSAVAADLADDPSIGTARGSHMHMPRPTLGTAVRRRPPLVLWPGAAGLARRRGLGHTLSRSVFPFSAGQAATRARSAP
jgi:hypothetical protein